MAWSPSVSFYRDMSRIVQGRQQELATQELQRLQAAQQLNNSLTLMQAQNQLQMQAEQRAEQRQIGAEGREQETWQARLDATVASDADATAAKREVVVKRSNDLYDLWNRHKQDNPENPQDTFSPEGYTKDEAIAAMTAGSRMKLIELQVPEAEANIELIKAKAGAEGLGPPLSATALEDQRSNRVQGAIGKLYQHYTSKLMDADYTEEAAHAAMLEGRFLFNQLSGDDGVEGFVASDLEAFYESIEAETRPTNDDWLGWRKNPTEATKDIVTEYVGTFGGSKSAARIFLTDAQRSAAKEKPADSPQYMDLTNDILRYGAAVRVITSGYGGRPEALAKEEQEKILKKWIDIDATTGGPDIHMGGMGSAGWIEKLDKDAEDPTGKTQAGGIFSAASGGISLSDLEPFIVHLAPDLEGVELTEFRRRLKTRDASFVRRSPSSPPPTTGATATEEEPDTGRNPIQGALGRTSQQQADSAARILGSRVAEPIGAAQRVDEQVKAHVKTFVPPTKHTSGEEYASMDQKRDHHTSAFQEHIHSLIGSPADGGLGGHRGRLPRETAKALLKAIAENINTVYGSDPSLYQPVVRSGAPVWEEGAEEIKAASKQAGWFDDEETAWNALVRNVLRKYQ